MVCPCKGCQLREEGCHSRCGGYARWKEKEAERNAEIRAARVEMNLTVQYMVDALRRSVMRKAKR